MQGHLDNVQLATAEKYGAGPPANWVEKCELAGYEGQFTEKCAPGFTRDPPNGGVYAPCVQCNCNGHAVTCEAETGKFLMFLVVGVLFCNGCILLKRGTHKIAR